MATMLQIDQMTLEEKLQTIEAIWDDLRQRAEEIPVPQWHKDLLDERRRMIEQGGAEFIEWETAKKEIAEEIS
jgi:hypothetical protein